MRVEAVGLTAPVAKIGRRYLQLRQSRMSLPNPHQLAGIAKREGLNQDRIDDAEERGVGSDTQRNGQESRPARRPAGGGENARRIAFL